MNRKNILAVLAVCICVFFLTGCTIGDEMYPLTEEETQTIAAYTAHIVSKYNKKAKGGLGVYIPEKETEESLEESQEKEVASTDTENENTAGSALEGDEQPQTGDENADSTDTSQEQQAQTVTMTQAMGIDGLDFKYKGYETSASISQGSYFSIDATDGMKYLQLKFNVEASKDVSVNIMQMNPRFVINISGANTYLSQATLLLNDLSTFEGDISEGKTKNLILLFEVDKSELKSIESLDLSVTMGENIYNVALE